MRLKWSCFLSIFVQTGGQGAHSKGRLSLNAEMLGVTDRTALLQHAPRRGRFILEQTIKY